MPGISAAPGRGAGDGTPRRARQNGPRAFARAVGGGRAEVLVGSPEVLAGAGAAGDLAGDLTDPVPGRDAPERGAWTEDERAAVWAVLLPAEPAGPVVLADLPPRTAMLLARRYPGALVLAREEQPGAVVWDGAHAPVEGGVGLLVCAAASTGALRPLCAPGAAVVTVGGTPRRTDGALVPDETEPVSFAMPGTLPGGPKALLARLSGKRVALRVEGVERSLADAVLADVSEALGRPFALAGVLVGSAAFLRATSPGGDVVVSVALPRPEDLRRHDIVDRVGAEVEQVRRWLPRELASGDTLGCHWRVIAWAGKTAGRRTWNAKGDGWAHAREIAAALAETPTGTIGAGWARRWSGPATAFGPEVRSAFERLLAPLPGDLPTSWCHGDLWQGNLLYDGDAVTLIDWENARRDAPAGIDAMLVEAWRRLYTQGRTFGQACAELCKADALPDGVPPLVVGGRAWADWNDAERRALVTAAFLLHAGNRALRDLDEDWREANLVPFLGDDAPPPEPDPAPAAQGSLESRAARGGLWLALGTIASKGMQTLVLVVLARLLAPRELGLLSIGALVVNVAGVVQELGVGDVLTYQSRRVRDAARTALTLMVSGSLAITAICWVAAPYLARFLRAPDGTGVIRGLAIVLPCYAAASVPMSLLRRELDFRRRIVPDVVPAVIGGVVSIALAIAHLGVAALVAGQIVQGILTPLVAWWVGRWVRPGWDRGLAREIVGYGRHVVGAEVLQLVLLNVDYTIVARVLGATALGLYSLAFRLCYLPFVNVSYVVNGAAFPYYCRLPSRDDLAPALTRVTGALAVTVTPIYALVALLAPHIEFLGEKWQPAIGSVRALAAYGLLLSFAQGGQTVLRAVGRPDLNLRLRALHVVGLAAVLLLVTHRGITTVSVAQAVIAGFVTAATWLLVRRHVPQLSYRALARQLAPPAAGVAAMAVVVIGMRKAGLNESESGSEGALVAAMGLVTYAAVVWWLGGARLREAYRLFRGRA
jgi:O-antigen/teichoic acid export membrane protein